MSLRKAQMLANVIMKKHLHYEIVNFQIPVKPTYRDTYIRNCTTLSKRAIFGLCSSIDSLWVKSQAPAMWQQEDVQNCPIKLWLTSVKVLLQDMLKRITAWSSYQMMIHVEINVTGIGIEPDIWNKTKEYLNKQNNRKQTNWLSNSGLDWHWAIFNPALSHQLNK